MYLCHIVYCGGENILFLSKQAKNGEKMEACGEKKENIVSTDLLYFTC